MHGDIDLEVIHPVPVRWAPRPTSAERLWFHDVATAATLRAVPPGSFEPVGPRPADGIGGFFAHDGHAWRPFVILGPNHRPLAPAPVRTAVSILGGGDTLHNGRSVGSFSSPLQPGEGIRQERATTWRRTVPDRALARAVEDLTDAARSRIAVFFEHEIRHDGKAVYVRLPPPIPHAFCGDATGGIEISVPSHQFGWAGSAGSPAHPGPYLRLVEAVEGTARAAQVADAFSTLAPFDGMGDPDVDVACFLSQTPQYLWRCWESLTANHAPDPAGEGARPRAEAALAVLRPLAARASVGMMAPADHPAAADAVHDLAVALLALYPGHGLRRRLAEAAGFVETVAWPRIAARDPDTGDIDAALGGLAP